MATKCIIGYALRNKTYGEVSKAIDYVDDQHKLVNHKLQKLVFDRESAIAVMQEEIESKGTKLLLKAAGQKVGLAEVTIRLIREKARATKAGVRAMYGYLPANQFNIDLCLDTISVLNRTAKEGKEHTPYEMFSNDHIDYERDFRCRWGELVIVKKPKGISSKQGKACLTTLLKLFVTIYDLIKKHHFKILIFVLDFIFSTEYKIIKNYIKSFSSYIIFYYHLC